VIALDRSDGHGPTSPAPASMPEATFRHDPAAFSRQSGPEQQ
jgi:hypothetical protein